MVYGSTTRSELEDQLSLAPIFWGNIEFHSKKRKNPPHFFAKNLKRFLQAISGGLEEPDLEALRELRRVLRCARTLRGAWAASWCSFFAARSISPFSFLILKLRVIKIMI